MDKVYHDIIDVFYGGVGDDIRQQNKELAPISQHFDIFTNPKRLVPYRAMEADEVTAYNIVMFLYANSDIYGLGIVSGGAKVKLYYKAGDPLTDTWTERHASGAEDSGGSRSEKVFVLFHDYAYGLTAGSRIWACGTLSGTPSFTSTALDLTAYTNTCQGIVTRDDYYLQPYDNKIAKKNGAGAGPTANWTLAALSLPDFYIITDVVERGDLAYIACRPSTGQGNSKVFLWDKVSTDILDTIDWGEGSIYILDEIDGELVGVSTIGGSSALAIKAKIVGRKWSGGAEADPFFELESDDTTAIVYGNHCKAKHNGHLRFGLKIKLEGTTYNQLGIIGRKKAGYPLVFSFDKLVDNDTAVSNSLQGIFQLGDYTFVAHNSDGSVNRDNDAAVFTNATATRFTQKINGSGQVKDAARRDKKLLMAGLMMKPLTSGQSVSLYYRVNATTAWTLIRTYSYSASDANANMSFEAGQADTDGDGTPNADFLNFKEIQFKYTSTGGAEITGVPYAWQFSGADISSE